MANSKHENDDRLLVDRLRSEADRFRPEFSEALHERIVQRLADTRRPAPRRLVVRQPRLLAMTVAVTAVSWVALSLVIWWPRGASEGNLIGQVKPPNTVTEVVPIEAPSPRPSPELDREPQRTPDARPDVDLRNLFAIPRSMLGTIESLRRETLAIPWDEIDHDLDREARIAADRILARLPVEMMVPVDEEQ